MTFLEKFQDYCRELFMKYNSNNISRMIYEQMSINEKKEYNHLYSLACSEHGKNLSFLIDDEKDIKLFVGITMINVFLNNRVVTYPKFVTSDNFVDVKDEIDKMHKIKDVYVENYCISKIPYEENKNN